MCECYDGKEALRSWKDVNVILAGQSCGWGPSGLCRLFQGCHDGLLTNCLNQFCCTCAKSITMRLASALLLLCIYPLQDWSIPSSQVIDCTHDSTLMNHKSWYFSPLTSVIGSVMTMWPCIYYPCRLPELWWELFWISTSRSIFSMGVLCNKDTDLVMLRGFCGESFLERGLRMEEVRVEQWKES